MRAGTPGAVLVAAVLIGLSAAAPARAAGLDCPVIGSGGVPPLAIDDRQIGRLTSGNAADLADEVGGLVARAKAAAPSASDDLIGDMLIGAYCPIVARTSATPAQRWRLMRQFDRAVYRALGAAALPQGAEILADVPLPPAVYDRLRRQAETAGQPPGAFMATILSRAAGP
ncbi:hypothetical protein [Rhodoplanes azumiensis]|uniref:Uncharacterized protein n=1 Tax=Rhodoplanes azumiensis TaxID=1897628 RepID=A0ABW5AF44_9BRAD